MPKPVIEAKIDVTKILKQHLFKGQRGTYLDVAYWENKDGKDQYENDGLIRQKLPRAARDAGEKEPIIGNWKWVEKPQEAANAPRQDARKYNLRPNTPDQRPKPPVDPDLDAPETDDIPF